MNPTRFGIASLPNKIDLYYETFGNEANPPILLIMGLDTQCLAFTEEFIQHSKNREHEMRQLRKEINELEQQNNVLHKHIENMKQSTSKIETDVEKYQNKEKILKTECTHQNSL